MSHLIFCPTAPQSGTWFTLRFFEKLGYDIEHTGAIMDREQDRALNMDRNIILNTHVFPFYYQPHALKESWPSFGGDGIQEYIVRKNKTSIGCIKLLASMYKTVIPIRDPLASLLTREARAPNLRHFYIVDAYVEIARQLADHPNVTFLPVDLNLSEKERLNLLRKVAGDCGVDINTKKNVYREVAEKWQKENDTPNNRFHAPYDAGDIDTIKEWLGPKWAEVQHLKNMGGILVPFLSSLGYNKHKTLLW